MKIVRTFLVCFALTLRWSEADDGIKIELNGIAITMIGERKTINEIAIYPPRGVPNRPLLVAAHGHGGTGPSEINTWLNLAKEHNFTIVCPTFLSSNNVIYLPDDDSYFNSCIQWMEDHLQYDKANAYMTGMSGGGNPTWYLGTKHPDFFHGIFLQSCNFDGDLFGLDLVPWREKPIQLIWGSKDLRDIFIENDQAIQALQAADCRCYGSTIIQGAQHVEHPDLVVNWIERLAASGQESQAERPEAK